MTVRKYTSRSQQTTLSSAVTSGAVVIPVTNASALFAGTTLSAGQTFTVVIDPDTALEEIVDVTSASSNNLTVTRAVDMSGAAAQDHSSGAVVRHMIIGRDLRESNLHVEATGSYNDGTGAHDLHGLGSSDGVVVGTDKAQTLTNKILTAPVLTGAGVDASIVFEGVTPDAFETTFTVVDPTQDNTITLPNTTGTVVLATATQTLTNKTMGNALNAGGFKITNLATPTDASDAVRKDFADAQVAAAATSATSAATSASSAATSATAAATSATSAATSVTSAVASATSATTSASSAAASATAAATSASSAATSATAAAATYDAFDDRYLGSKTSDPTLDNDGNALLTGALYFNSVGNFMKVYNGSSWGIVAPDTSNFIDKTVLTGKGSIISASSATTPVELTTAATDGYVLSVSNAATSGLAWSPNNSYSAPTLGSTVINSGATVSTITNLTLTTPTFTNPTSVVADLNGYTTTVTAGGTTTLTATSTRYQIFTGSAAQTIVMPVVSTLKLGWQFEIINNAVNNNLAIQSSGGNAIMSVPPGASSIITCTAITGTTSSSWFMVITGGPYAFLSSGTGNVVFTSFPTLSSPILTGARIDTITTTANTNNPTIYNNITTGTIGMAGAQTTAALDIAGAATRTGAVNIANATTSSHTVAVANGVTATGNTKTVNIGTSGAAGSTTNIALGGTAGTSNITLNGNLTATPAQGTVTTASTGVGYMGIPASNAATTGAYTVVAADAGEHIYSTATRTITIPANATTAFPIGTTISFVNATGTTLTIAITTDTLLLAGAGTTGSRTLAAFGWADCLKITATSWLIRGNGLT